MGRVLFKSDVDRSRVCKESYNLARLLKLDSAEQVAKAMELLQLALTACPLDVPSLTLRVSLQVKTNAVAGALVDLATLLRVEEEALRSSTAPPALTVSVRRRIAGLYGLRASLQQSPQAAESRVTSAEQLQGSRTSDLERAASLEPDNAAWPFELGLDCMRSAESLATVNGTCDTQVREQLVSAAHYLQAALLDPRTNPTTGTGTAAVGSGIDGIRLPTSVRYRCQVNLALCRLHLGEFSLAQRVLRSALEHNDNAQVHFLLGHAAEGARDLQNPAATKAVRDHFQRAAELDPHQPKYQLCTGVCLLREGDAAGALRHLNEAAACDRTNPTLYFLRGCAYVMMGDRAAALDQYERAASLSAESSAFLGSGMVRVQQKQWSAAEEALVQASSSGTCSFSCLACLGLLYHARGRLYEAITLYHEALAALPASTASVLEASRASVSLTSAPRVSGNRAADSNVQAAYGDVRTAILDRLGVCYREAQQWRNALRCFQHVEPTVREESENQKLLLRMAETETLGRNWYGALRTTESLEADPDTASCDAAHCRSVALRQLGEPAKALVWCDRALTALAHATERAKLSDAAVVPPGETAPLPLSVQENNDADGCLLNRAYTLFDLQRYSECVDELCRMHGVEEGDPVDSKDPGTTAEVPVLTTDLRRRAEVHYLRGRAEFALKDFTASVRSFDKAAVVLPALKGTKAFCYCYGVALMSEGNAPAAARWLSLSAVDGATEDGEPPMTPIALLSFHERAKARQTLGDAAGAASDFGVVLAHQPQNFNALVRRSFALKNLGKFAEAAVDWRRAEVLDTSGILQLIQPADMYATSYVVLCDPGEEDGGLG